MKNSGESYLSRAFLFLQSMAQSELPWECLTHQEMKSNGRTTGYCRSVPPGRSERHPYPSVSKPLCWTTSLTEKLLATRSSKSLTSICALVSYFLVHSRANPWEDISEASLSTEEINQPFESRLVLKKQEEINGVYFSIAYGIHISSFYPALE